MSHKCPNCSATFAHRQSKRKHIKNCSARNSNGKKSPKLMTTDDVPASFLDPSIGSSETDFNMLTTQPEKVTPDVLYAIMQQDPNYFKNAIAKYFEQRKKEEAKFLNKLLSKMNIKNMQHEIDAVSDSDDEVVCFNARSIDIFEIKRILHGPDAALQYIHNLVTNRNANNKHDWLRDSELLNPAEGYPFKLLTDKTNNSLLQIEIQVAPDKTEIDDGLHLDKIATEIVINAVLKAHNDFNIGIIQALENNEFNSELELEVAMCHPCIYDRRGHSIHDHLAKFRNIKPTTKYVKSLMRVLS